MNKRLIIYILGTVLAYSCSKPTPSILAFCEKDEKGDYILKWEIYPEQDNADIDIYASDNDSIFSSVPLFTTSANNYIAIVNNGDSLNYRFFKLRVSGEMSAVISTRYYELDSVQNFRDLGGYKTIDNRAMKWGKVFRSGHFGYATEHDLATLSNLGIKTIIDLRPLDVAYRRPDRLIVDNNIALPITQSAYDRISEQVINGKFFKGDAIIYTQDLYRDIVVNYHEAYKKFFDLLMDEKNYPVAFHCSLGKDQTGIAAYFLLRALGISSEVAEDDYKFSDKGIDKSKLTFRVDTLSESKQEALTMLTRTDPAYLRYAISCIRQQYGSVDEYLTKELEITDQKKMKLQQILLYR